MSTNMTPYYGRYLKLDQILEGQQLLSEKQGSKAHDEMLFIITHQTYELWFKQIIFEINSVISLMDEIPLPDRYLSLITHRLRRIVEIQKVLIQQIDVMETMTALDFLDFRDLLTPASGFQSLQFRLLEHAMGLRISARSETQKTFFNDRLSDKDHRLLLDAEQAPTLLEKIESWLERMPFAEQDNFNFWSEFEATLESLFEKESEIIENNQTLTETQKLRQLAMTKKNREHFALLFHRDKMNELKESGEKKFSFSAIRSALFIFLYRDEPMLFLPHQLLDTLTAIDEHWTIWRYRHALMAERLLGRKIGTGGSSGHDYLKKSADESRVFRELADLASFFIPRKQLPDLPDELRKQLNFFYSEMSAAKGKA